MMKKVALYCALLLVSLNLMSQELVVRKPITIISEDTNYTSELIDYIVDDSSYIKTDFNGDTCALLIIDNYDDIGYFGELWFEGVLSHEYYGHVSYSGDCWWVWLAPGSNWITLGTPSSYPLRIDFQPVLSGKIYTLGLGNSAGMASLAIREPFHADYSMIDAVRYGIKDNQGVNCALLRIGLAEHDVTFSCNHGDVVKSEIHNSGEWWVWVKAGATSLTIELPQCEPLNITFDAIQPSVTYLMSIIKYYHKKNKDWAAVGFIYGPPSDDYTLDDLSNWIFFEQGHLELETKEQIVIVKNISKILKKHPEYICYVVGVCNYRYFLFPEAYNLKITERVAVNVKKYMIDKCGIQEERIIYDYRGKSVDPVLWD